MNQVKYPERARTESFSASRVNRVLRELTAPSAPPSDLRRRWLSAVASRVVAARPDLRDSLLGVLGVEASASNPLETLSIGEIGVCYEALLARLDRHQRKRSGQYFTPDDAAHFMAAQARGFLDGVWMDPCCGVGNLAWHLAAVAPTPSRFIREQLILIDRDSTALRSAVALIAAQYAAAGDQSAVEALDKRSMNRDFLSSAPLPPYDHAILNPPYARSTMLHGFDTATCRDSFAYFVEKVAKQAKGFVAVTPASFLSAPKFQPLRTVLDQAKRGGDVFVFDNVPDTLFRGYKYGSNNTSKTNFVRAAITVCAPTHKSWRITPILRWRTAQRSLMFAQCAHLLSARKLGPHGEWAKLSPASSDLWNSLVRERGTLKALLSDTPTRYSLDVALTPRYFISATFERLERASKATLYFHTEPDRNRAAIVLNSSLPYIWWRALDGGVTLPLRVLLSTPMPEHVGNDRAIIEKIRASEQSNLVTKLNAGRQNQNVKHPHDLVHELDHLVLRPHTDIEIYFSNSMFPLR